MSTMGTEHADSVYVWRTTRNSQCKLSIAQPTYALKFTSYPVSICTACTCTLTYIYLVADQLFQLIWKTAAAIGQKCLGRYGRRIHITNQDFLTTSWPANWTARKKGMRDFNIRFKFFFPAGSDLRGQQDGRRHYRSLKRGIQSQSGNRVREIHRSRTRSLIDSNDSSLRCRI